MFRKRRKVFLLAFCALLTASLACLAACQTNIEKNQTHTITFYAFDEVVGTVHTAGNESITLPAAPTVSDYDFVGWFLDKDVWNQPFTADSFADTALTRNVDVFAQYVYAPPVFTVEFNTDGGTYVPPVTTDILREAPETTKDGCDFEGWYLDAEKTEKVIFPFTVTNDCTLYAKWTAKPVSFTLNSSNQISGATNLPENGEIYIPATVNGVTVKGIDSYAFRFNTDLVSVEIDPAITYFGVGVFWGCKNLKSVTMSDNVTQIPSDMFDGCTSLTQFDFPSSLRVLGASAFMNSGLTSAILPDSMQSIWEYAFKGCTALTSVNLGKVESLSQGIFQGCTSLKSIQFPDTLKEVDGNYMLMGCSQLTRIIVPDVAVPLNYNFVHDTPYYDDAANWENGALYVGNHLLTVDSEFKNKTSFTVREGTITVARLAFYETYSSAKLTSLTLPNSLKAIGERAFEDCNSLTDVNIPESVEKIGKSAFPDSAISADGYVGSWLIKYDLSGTSVIVKEGTVGIADGQITDAQSKVTQVSLPSSLRYIGKENFRSMSNLTEISLPENLVSIGESAFSFCSSLKSLYISESVAYIGETAFNQIPGLTLNIARAQNDIPVGWQEDWDLSYASEPIRFVWNYNQSN